MAGPGGSAQDAAARDDAHLRSLGIKPELKRTLGFLSIFAVAFSYISVSTGTFTNQAVAFGVGGVAIFWAWPLVILGQTFVALNFAELSSHFPVAGSIYQWSKRLSNRTLGWFTGWIYFWAGVITVTAVAATVPLVLSTIYPTRSSWAIRRRSAASTCSPSSGSRSCSPRRSSTSSASGCCRSSTTSASGAEIIGMVVFALILLFFANHQSPSVLFDTLLHLGSRRRQLFRGLPGRHVHGPVRGLRLRHGRDVRRRDVDASRQAPRGVLSSIWLSGIVGAIFLLAVTLSFKDIAAADRGGPGVRVPDRDDDQGQSRPSPSAG